MHKQENNLGVFYSLPMGLSNKYRGCGNGKIVVNTNNDEVIDFDYLDEKDEIIKEQNVAMHQDAGEVLLVADHYTTYRANFSCYQACLF